MSQITSHHDQAAARARGFTLVELLVVVGIIGVLIAILMPMLSKARLAARDVTCANNIRQVSAAAIMYRDQNRFFPCLALIDMNSAAKQAVPYPDLINISMLNAMGPYLFANWVPLPYSGTVYPAGTDKPLPAASLPASMSYCAGCWLPDTFVCPDYLAEKPDLTASSNDPYYAYSTGYSYYAQADHPKSPRDGYFYTIQGAMIVHSDYLPQSSGSPGVLWADHFIFGTNTNTYTFAHWKTSDGTVQPRGIHVGFSDGSVAWQAVDLSLTTEMAGNLGGTTLPAPANSMLANCTLVVGPQFAGGGGMSHDYYFFATLNRY